MQPNTYTPNTIEEIAAFAAKATRSDLLELKQQWILASETIAQAEKTYLYQGIQFHVAAATFSETEQDAAREACKAAFTISKLPNGSTGALPTSIAQIEQLRGLREKLYKDIKGGNWKDGQVSLAHINTILGQTESLLVVLDDQHQAGFVDIGGLWTLKRERMDNDEGIKEEIRQGLCREWILQLPEVKAGLELGTLEDEDQAVASTIESSGGMFDTGGGGDDDGVAATE